MTRTSLILWYILIINLFTFIARGVDKYKATSQKQRISEKTLLLFTGSGGRVGAILGMQVFRHKTIKGKFLTKFWIIATIWIIITILLLFWL